MLAPLLAGLVLKTATGGMERVFPAADRKATVVFTVLSECPIAQAFSPEMGRLAREFGPRGVRFLMAFADGKPSEWSAHVKAYGLPFPAVGASPELRGLIRATAVPTAAVIGAGGRVAYVGRIDDRYPALGTLREVRRHDLRLALEAFLAGRPVVPARTAVVGCALPNG